MFWFFDLFNYVGKFIFTGNPVICSLRQLYAFDVMEHVIYIYFVYMCSGIGMLPLPVYLPSHCLIFRHAPVSTLFLGVFPLIFFDV